MASEGGLRWLTGAVVVMMGFSFIGLAVETTRSGTTTDPVRLIVGAPAATQKLGTASFSSSLTFEQDGDTETALTTSGSSDFATRAFQLSEKAEGKTVSTIRFVDGVEYFQTFLIPLPGGAHWVKILPRDLGVGAVDSSLGSGDPTNGLQFLGGAVGQPVLVGPEKMDGVATTHYRITLDLAQFTDKLGKAVGHISPEAQQAIEALQGKVDLAHLPAQVWLDSKGRVRQFSYTLNLPTAAGPVSEVETTSFSNFGAPVRVVVPAASDTVPFSSVKGAFAALLDPSVKAD